MNEHHAIRGSWTGLGWWGWLAILCASGTACFEVPLRVDRGGSQSRVLAGWQIFGEPGYERIDLLLAIDDSQDMSSLQTKMFSELPALLGPLQAMPSGLDLQVAVVSSNAGVGAFDLPDLGCPLGGDNGVFEFQPRGSCVLAPVAVPQPPRYFSMSHGVANFSGDLANQIACVGLLGQQGCRFSGPFKSIREALSPAGAGQATQVNLGFLRPDALLAVVLLSNKDDCSTPRDSPLGDPTQTRMSDSLGPFDRFRCNELGHLCQINGALTHPPRGAAADLPGCVSNESSNDMLTKVADEVAFLQSLKTNPALLTVAAITGPVTPYSIDMVQEAGAPEAHPRVHPSCQSTTGDYGEPAVRIQQWANALGGMTFPICADSLAPALQTIGQGIVDRAGAMCFTKPFPPRTDSAQPNCRVADLSNMAGMSIGRVGQSIPNCVDNGGAAPCWTAVLDPAHCGGGTKWLVITRTTPAPPGSFVGISCHSCSLDGPEVGC